MSIPDVPFTWTAPDVEPASRKLTDLCECGHSRSMHRPSGLAAPAQVCAGTIPTGTAEITGRGALPQGWATVFPARPCPCGGFAPSGDPAPDLPDDSPAVLAAAAGIAAALGKQALAQRLHDLSAGLNWPEHWPPRPGDVWRTLGGQLWFAYRRRTDAPVVLVSDTGEHLAGIELSTAAQSMRLARSAASLRKDQPGESL